MWGNGEKMETVNPSAQLGLLGRKVGMMRIFSVAGDSVPVTVLDVSNNRIAQIKTMAVDGYSAVQLSFGARKASRVNKALSGHLSKAGLAGVRHLREFRLSPELSALHVAGSLVAPDIFQEGQRVDVRAISIGKGFAGTIKRHNFRSQRASHGNSRSHNVPGSISMAQDPGRVFPGKKMSGHMGSENVTVQNLSVVRIDKLRSLLFIRGAIPGAKGGLVIIKPAVKVRLLKEGRRAA
jgi:large subunit ribosomal protein L3